MRRSLAIRCPRWLPRDRGGGRQARGRKRRRQPARARHRPPVGSTRATGHRECCAPQRGPLPTNGRPRWRPGGPAIGAIVDAQQMAEYVSGPWEVDRKVITPYLSSFTW